MFFGGLRIAQESAPPTVFQSMDTNTLTMEQPTTPPTPSGGNTPRTPGMDRKIERKFWSKRRMTLTAAGSIPVLLVLYLLFFADTSSRLNVEVDRLTISTVTRGAFQEYIPVTGTVLPIETFYLDAIEGGRVAQIFVEAGNFVRVGDPLLRLANTNLQLDVMYREALSYEQINNAQNRRLNIEQNSISVRTQLAEVRYQVERTRLNFTRDSVLAAKSLISPEEFTRTKDEFDYWVRRQTLALENYRQDSLLRVNQLSQLENSIDRLETNLEMVKQSIDNLVVRAPITGLLTSLNAEIGQSKSPGQRLGQIDVLDSFKVRVPVDEFYISRVSAGLTGEFDLAGARYDLVIRKVYPEVRDGRFEVDMSFLGTVPPDIRRGQSVQIRLELGAQSEALLLARGGFYQTTGGQWVYVLDASGDVAVRRSIKLGRQNPQNFEVLEGLNPGDRVITSGYENYGDIQKLMLN